MKNIVLLIITLFTIISCTKKNITTEIIKPGTPPESIKAPVKTNEDFAPEVENYLTADKATSPKKGGIVFAGTTAIKRCSDIADRFKNYPVLQRSLTDCETANTLFYADQLIKAYRPSVIFLYSGEDDIINGKSTNEAYVQFLKLAQLITKDLPETRICYMAVKPSPGRAAHQNKFEEYNNRVKAYIDKQANCNWYYLDTYSPLLSATGSPDAKLYADDKINLNSKGYDVWEKLIRSYLEM